MIATLPMYDFEEVRPASDRLWRTVRDALREADIDAPDALERGTSPTPVLFSQVCGRQLPGANAVSPLVAPRSAVEGFEPGTYRSYVVVRSDDPARSLEASRGRRFAFNGRASYSGFFVVERVVGPPGAYFGALVETGAHALSLRCVQRREADCCVVDGLSYELLARHRPEATAGLEVVEKTPSAPAPPYVLSDSVDEVRRARATKNLMALDLVIPELLFAGFVKAAPPSDYRLMQ